MQGYISNCLANKGSESIRKSVCNPYLNHSLESRVPTAFIGQHIQIFIRIGFNALSLYVNSPQYHLRERLRQLESLYQWV